MVFLDYLPRIRISELTPLVNAQKRAKNDVIGRLVRGGIKYCITVSINEGKFSFSWEYQGGQCRQEVNFLSIPSNLGKGEYRFFLCPYTGRKCRKLFFIGNSIASRFAFKHVYSYQHESHSNRFLVRLGRMNNPQHKYGRETYRGKITRYGKKVMNYYEKMRKLSQLSEIYLIPRPRGRQPNGRCKSIPK